MIFRVTEEIRPDLDDHDMIPRSAVWQGRGIKAYTNSVNLNPGSLKSLGCQIKAQPEAVYFNWSPFRCSTTCIGHLWRASEVLSKQAITYLSSNMHD